MDVAAAAVKQADAQGRRAATARRSRRSPLRPDRPPRATARERAPTPKAQSRTSADKPRTRQARASRSPPDGNVARLYVGAGRKAKMRPADLVGAIVNEAGVDPRAIGAIQITDRFSLVEVPDEIADDIIGTLRAATIKGKRVPVRRDREQGGVTRE